MSYAIKLRVHEGKLVNHEAVGVLPDGQIELSGHDGESYRSIAVSHFDHEGNQVFGASHSEAPYRVDLLPVPGHPTVTAVPPQVRRE